MANDTIKNCKCGGERVHIDSDTLITQIDNKDATRLIEYHECPKCGSGVRVAHELKVHMVVHQKLIDSWHDY